MFVFTEQLHALMRVGTISHHIAEADDVSKPAIPGRVTKDSLERLKVAMYVTDNGVSHSCITSD